MDLSSKVMGVIVGLGLASSITVMSIESRESVGITISWIPATEFEDGERLVPLEIDSYIISWREFDGSILGEVELDGSERSYKLEKLSIGKYVFSIVAKSVYGTNSRSVELVKTIGSTKSIL